MNNPVFIILDVAPLCHRIVIRKLENATFQYLKQMVVLAKLVIHERYATRGHSQSFTLLFPAFSNDNVTEWLILRTKSVT